MTKRVEVAAPHLSTPRNKLLSLQKRVFAFVGHHVAHAAHKIVILNLAGGIRVQQVNQLVKLLQFQKNLVKTKSARRTGGRLTCSPPSIASNLFCSEICTNVCVLTKPSCSVSYTLNSCLKKSSCPVSSLLFRSMRSSCSDITSF